jgi:hypothetical protein
MSRGYGREPNHRVLAPSWPSIALVAAILAACGVALVYVAVEWL